MCLPPDTAHPASSMKALGDGERSAAPCCKYCLRSFSSPNPLTDRKKFPCVTLEATHEQGSAQCKICRCALCWSAKTSKHTDLLAQMEEDEAVRKRHMAVVAPWEHR